MHFSSWRATTQNSRGSSNWRRCGLRSWLQPLLEQEQEIIGRDWYPYGIEQNRPSIEALRQYAHEHGLTGRRIKLEELFAPSTMRDIPLSEGQQV